MLDSIVLGCLNGGVLSFFVLSNQIGFVLGGAAIGGGLGTFYGLCLNHFLSQKT